MIYDSEAIFPTPSSASSSFPTAWRKLKKISKERASEGESGERGEEREDERGRKRERGRRERSRYREKERGGGAGRGRPSEIVRCFIIMLLFFSIVESFTYSDSNTYLLTR